MARLIPAIAACGALVASASMTPQTTTPGLPATSAIEEQFKYGSIGTEDGQGIPYWIWRALPRLFADKLPAGGFGALGMITEAGRDVPIGFSRKTIWGVERVGINCAFCHTARVRTSENGPAMIVLAGPSHQLDVQRYSQFLDAAAADPRFNATDLLATIGTMTELSWYDATMHRLLLIPAVKRGLLQHKEQLVWMASRPRWGPGRIDPQNPFKFTTLEQPLDPTIGNSDMPPLWNMKARRGMALHWDGMNTVYREVLLSSGIGNGATRTSLAVEAIDRLGAWFDGLPPPAFPFPTDSALALKGRAVYDQTCAVCHAPGGARTGRVIPIEEIGTDRHRLDTWTSQAATAFNAVGEGQPWAFTHFRKTNGMVAGLLDGVWLRAPYFTTVRCRRWPICSSRLTAAPPLSIAASTFTIPCGWASCRRARPPNDRGFATRSRSRATETPATSTAPGSPPTRNERCSNFSRRSSSGRCRPSGASTGRVT